MPAAERDLYIEAETTWRMRFTWCQPRADGAPADAPLIPYDLTGARAWMHLRARYGSPVLVGVDSIGVDGGIYIQPSEIIKGADGQPRTVTYRGCLEIRLRPEQTAAISARRGRYDLLVQMPGRYIADKPQDVETHRILQGAFELSRAITIPIPQPAQLVAAIVILPTAPTQPLVDLEWTDVPAASFYEVLRNGLIIASTNGPNLHTFRDLNPPVGSNIYTLRAHNVFGQSTDSDPVPVQITTPVVTAPTTDPVTDPTTDPVVTPVVTPDPTPVVTP